MSLDRFFDKIRRFDGTLPESARLMWADDEFAIHYDEPSGTVFVTESLSDEEGQDQEQIDVTESLLRQQIKVLDNMSDVLAEMRAELVRAL